MWFVGWGQTVGSCQPGLPWVAPPWAWLWFLVMYVTLVQCTCNTFDSWQPGLPWAAPTLPALDCTILSPLLLWIFIVAATILAACWISYKWGQIFNFQYTVNMCCNKLWKYLEGFQQNLETFLRTKFCQRRSLDLTQFFLRSFLQMIFLFTMSGNQWCEWSPSIRLHCSAIMCSL